MKKKKKKNAKWFILGAIAIIIVLIIVGRSGGEKGTMVTVVNPIRKSITEIIPANGKIHPVVEVKISPDVSGEIIDLNVAEGDMVKKGTLLIRIKQDIYLSNRDRATASLNSVKAQLAQQEAQFQQIELSYKRNKTLYEQGAISVSDYESALSQYDIAKEQINAAQFNVQSAGAVLKEAEENLFKTTIYAPMDGIVSKLNVERGERVVGTSQMAGTEMLRIANFEQMEVLVDVNENDIIRVAPSDTASILVDAYPGKVFKGVVTQIANSAKGTLTSVDQVTNFEVKIYILPESYRELTENKSSNPFRPGMSASVDIQTQTAYNAIAIPLQCITTRPELVSDSLKLALRPGEVVEQVFVLQDDMTVKPVRIQSGIQDHSHIEILSGLKEEDRIVSGPYLAISKTLRANTKVLLLDAKKTEDDAKKEERSIEVSIN